MDEAMMTERIMSLSKDFFYLIKISTVDFFNKNAYQTGNKCHTWLNFSLEYLLDEAMMTERIVSLYKEFFLNVLKYLRLNASKKILVKHEISVIVTEF